MPYQSITIKNAIDKISRNQIVLPSIQREFVWGTEQIEILFDSLMRDYPIGTLLMWDVQQEDVQNFIFYKVLDKYHQTNNRHNEEIALNDSVQALLDGQQRMTSLYIALKGSYTTVHGGNCSEKYLYLNLIQNDDIDTKYEFKFLTISEASNRSETEFWFKCSDILAFKAYGEVSIYLTENKEYLDMFATLTLNQFWRVFRDVQIINYYLHEESDLENVLQIFIRTNSGGTKLTYSDLLLSVVTSQWTTLNARKEIHDFVDEINKIGVIGFNFNKDLVLKSCLVLLGFDVKFKTRNFQRDNMVAIERNWEGISNAIMTTVKLVDSFGYHHKNLSSDFSIIPIAYFIYKNKFTEKDVFNEKWKRKNFNLIKQWLSRSLLKGVFGGHSDNVHPKIRDIINESGKTFPLNEIISHYNVHEIQKSISFSDDDIEKILNAKYSSQNSHCILTLLYDGLNDQFTYQQDHIHPKSYFTQDKLKALGISDMNVEKIIKSKDFNKLPNIQLLKSSVNRQKSDKSFSEWLHQKFPEEDVRKSYLKDNFIPTGTSLELKDFEAFYNARKEAMRKKLKSILQAPIANT